MHRHASILLMLLAQLCSAILATIGRVLRTGHGDDASDAMGTSEILLLMTLLTALLSWLTLSFSPSRSHTPSPPSSSPSPSLSPAHITTLLLLRSTAGFLGIWSFYFSLRTLSLSTASLLTFLAPILAVLLLGLLPGAHLSPAQLLAAAVSLSGVLFVLQPWSAAPIAHTGPGKEEGKLGQGQHEYILAVSTALAGVLGGAISFVAIARLGDAVHPLRTVAWFSTTCAVLSGGLLAMHPQDVRFPKTPLQWGLVGVLGTLAFAMHWLMTASLTWDGDSRRPLNFVYTQILFAMVADRAVWGVAPDAYKYVGGALIIGSAVFVASTGGRREYALVQRNGDEEDYDPLELDLGKERAEISTESEI